MGGALSFAGDITMALCWLFSINRKAQKTAKQTHIHIHKHTHTYTHTHICAHAHMHACMHAGLHRIRNVAIWMASVSIVMWNKKVGVLDFALWTKSLNGFVVDGYK